MWYTYTILYIEYFNLRTYIYAFRLLTTWSSFFLPLLHLLNVSLLGHAFEEKGCVEKEAFRLSENTISPCIFVHIRLKKKKKVEGNMYGKKGRGRASYIHFFPRRHNSPSTSFPAQVGRIINMKKNWYYFRCICVPR